MNPGRLVAVRILVVLTLLTGTWYVGWRWLDSINWVNWWIGVPLVLAETYALIDAYLFGITMWRARKREAAGDPDPDATVDVFITTYNEPVEMVVATAQAALAIDHPHTTWILDDGNRPEMAAEAHRLGVGYLTRSEDWTNRPRHAKAGNLNNALFETDGEFLLILDADQIPDPEILDRTLGYFNDPAVALVQTPQWFTNVTESDPLGSQAPLFYGPVQQGKDGWNAAFFCGSNAVLRREALMQLGIVGYVREVRQAVRAALETSSRVVRKVRRASAAYGPAVQEALAHVAAAADTARGRLRDGEELAEITYRFRRAADEASRRIVADDFAQIRADLAALEAGSDLPLPVQQDAELGTLIVDDSALEVMADRNFSPLAALQSVEQLVAAVDVDRSHEAQPLMPLATISVTEDMATAMRLHSLGWKSVYHHETLARGLAPDDLRTMLQQRLRWAQGTMQVFLRENPLVQRGLKLGQRLMYFATMWSYLSGFAAVIYVAAPVLYLCFSIKPVDAYGVEFAIRFIPYIVVNQLLFFIVGYGVKTWRGHQYSLALFPLWIRACWTAAANVFGGRSLGFVVTPKTRQAVESFPWRLILPQLVAVGFLVGASVVGIVRFWTGTTDSVIGTGVNLAWVLYDLVVMSVIFQAARYRGPQTLEEVPADGNQHQARR